MDMIDECLDRNLLSFGLIHDIITGDGNCCFTSIAKVLNERLLEGDFLNNEAITMLLSNDLCKGTASDANRLRQLFCEEVMTNEETYCCSPIETMMTLTSTRRLGNF